MYLYGQSELANHLSYDGYLLEVLLAKESAIGLHEHKELAHDLRYTVEVAWAMRSLHSLSEEAEVKLTGVRLGIHLLDGGQEGDVYLTVTQAC